MRRPDTLRRRQTRGRYFGEDAVLIRHAPGAYNSIGIWEAGVAERVDIRVSQDAVRELSEPQMAGHRLTDVRRFYLHDYDVDAIRVGVAAADSDRIEYGGVSYRVVDAADWQGAEGLIQVTAVRESPQVMMSP